MIDGSDSVETLVNKPQALDREGYYADYWRHPQFEDCTYVNWKVALTSAHPRVAGARSILDVGAGGGALLAGLARPGQGRRLAAVEVSSEAVDALRARGFEAERVDLDAAGLPFADGGFDVVLCYDVFEHLFSPDRLRDEIHRVLAPGGAAFLCVPNTLNGFNRLKFALGEYVDIMDTSHRTAELFSNHIRLFSRALFERFLSPKFRVVERHFYFPPRFTDPRFRLPASLAKMVTGPRLHQLLPSIFALGFLYVCDKG
jgi:SAM-dependent methyltransferase